MTWLVVGLGNPGKQYAKTRHNVGFRVLEILKGRLADASAWKTAGAAESCAGRVGNAKTVLERPQTFMNESGRAVAPLAKKNNVPPERVVIIHDDKDLALGQIRLRPDGSAGGHNGIKSVIAHLGTEKFPRVRVGVGRPTTGTDTADYVLATFRPEEKPLMAAAEKRAAEAAEAIIREGIEAAMNKYNVSGDK